MSNEDSNKKDQFFEYVAGGSFVLGAIVFFITVIKYNPSLVFILISGVFTASYIRYLYVYRGKLKPDSVILYLTGIGFIWSLYLFYKYMFISNIKSSGVILEMAHKIHSNYTLELNLAWYLVTFLLGLIIYYTIYYIASKKESFVESSIFNNFNSRFFSNVPKRKNSSEILIGNDKLNNRPVYLPLKDIDRHIQIMGGTGAGKTNLLKNMIEPLIEKNESVIFLDMKAEKEMITWLKNTHKLYKKEKDFSYISTNFPEESAKIHPTKKEDISDIVPMIMNSIIWSEPYYEERCRQGLIAAVSYLKLVQKKGLKFINLNDILSLIIDEKNFNEYEKKYNIYDFDKEAKSSFTNLLYNSDLQKNITKLVAALTTLQNSSLGSIFFNAKSSDKSMAEVVKKGGFLYIQLNAMKDQISANLAGKILLQDLINTVGEKNAKGEKFAQKKCTIIVDEFADFASENFIMFLNKCRSAGVRVIIAYQSSGDLEHISNVFSKRVSSNCGIKLFFGTNEPTEAEEMSNRVGTRKSTKKTQKLVEETIEKIGSIRDVEEFIIHPNDIKNMDIGDILMLNKWGKTKYAFLKAPLAREYKENNDKILEEYLSSSEHINKLKMNIWRPRISNTGYWTYRDIFYDPYYHHEEYVKNISI